MSTQKESDKLQIEATGARVMRSPVKSRENILTRSQAKRVNEEREEFRDAEIAGGKETDNPRDRFLGIVRQIK